MRILSDKDYEIKVTDGSVWSVSGATLTNLFEQKVLKNNFRYEYQLLTVEERNDDNESLSKNQTEES